MSGLIFVLLVEYRTELDICQMRLGFQPLLWIKLILLVVKVISGNLVEIFEFI